MHTLADLITTAAQRRGSTVVLTLVGERTSESWTCADVYRCARRVAQMIQSRGIAPGGRVVIWAPNGPRWVGAFFGCMLAGAVVVPLDVRSTAEFVSENVVQAAPRLAVATRATAASLAALGVPCLAVEDLDAALPPDDTSWEPVRVKPDDLAEIICTSGTTGMPKGVMLSHRNILSNLEAAYSILPPSKTYRILSLLPLSHVFEQVAELFYVLSVGARTVYVNAPQPETIFRAMTEEGITGIPMVPQMLGLFMSGLEREVQKAGKWRTWERAHRLAPRLPRPARRLLFRQVHARLGGRLDVVVCGGSYLDPKLAQRWENLGIRVVIGYGTTESSALITANSSTRRNLRSVGRPMPCNEVRIAPDGEILVRGNNIARGYWCNEEATQATFEGGWYRTGDLGYFDAAGDLYLKGRKKNLIALSNGRQVCPEEIENVLLAEPGVTDAVVIGREQQGDVVLHAILLLQPDADAVAIVEGANKRLGPQQQVNGHTIWPEPDFPRTRTLKPQRDEVRRRLAAPQGQS